MSKSDSSSRAARMLVMVLHLPVGEWAKTSSVHAAMKSLGYQISLRGVQRDLKSVADVFQIEKRWNTRTGIEWRRTRPLE